MVSKEVGRLSQDYRDAAAAVISRASASPSPSRASRSPPAPVRFLSAPRGRSLSPVSVPRSLPVVADRFDRTKAQVDAANEKVNSHPYIFSNGHNC